MAKYKFLNNVKTGVVERVEITGDELKELEARERLGIVRLIN